MLLTVTLLCFSLPVKSVLAADHLTVPTVGGGSDRGTEKSVQNFMKTGQELLVNVSQQHPERNSGGKQKEEWRVKKITHMIGKNSSKNEDKVEIKDYRMRDHAEDRREKEETVEIKGTEEKVKESTMERSNPIAESAKPPEAQTSGWYWAAETVDVTTIPIVTHPPHLPLTDPSVEDLHPSRQHSAVEEAKLTLEFRVEGHHLILDLHPTRDLLAATYREPAIGIIRSAGPPVECEFQGSIRGMTGSLVALSLCDGIRGVIVSRELELIVEPTHSASSLKEPHRIYSSKFFQHSSGACGVRSGDEKNSKRKHNKSSRNISKERVDAILHRERREALHGGPLWTKKTTRYVELVLVADHSYYLTYLKTTAARCRAIVNIINALFRPVGVVVVLTHLEIWDTKDQIVVSEDSDKTLDNMKAYRQKLLASLSNVPNDNTQLLTTVEFEGITIGKATVSGMCSYENSVGIVQDQKYDSVSYVAQTMAHEIGHNLGLNHDEDDEDCQCDTDNCIMGTNINSHTSKMSWSSCSKRNLTSSLTAFSFDCLKNVPSKLISGSTCGNGIVEKGEQCDCGPPEFCENPCCIAESCRLVGNASCASGSCCDTQTCRPKTVWTLCRPAVGDCDIPEHCTGDSEFCPSDIVERDGISCGRKGHCYKGECGSHEGRCQQVWGASASSGPPECYIQYNVRGDSQGNCGKLDHDSEAFQPCSTQDAFCGTLHCHVDADVKPKHGIVSYTPWSENNHDCRIIVSSDDPTSHWLSPDGAFCGDGRMCVNQRCVPIPGSSWVILFWIVLVLLLFAICCMWDHLRWWWEKKGRACLSPTFPFCATCLDTCCCPFMTKIFRCCWYPLMTKIIQWIKSVCPFCKPKKSSPKEVDPGSKGANGTLVSQVDQNTGESSQINSWAKADGQLVVEIPTNRLQNTDISSNLGVLHHNSVDTDHPADHNRNKVFSEYAVSETLLNEVNSANNWTISPDVTEGQLSRTTPSQDMLCDNEVILKLSKLTHNFSIVSGKENKPQESSRNKSVEYIDKICESPYNQQMLLPQGSCTPPVKIVPVRKAPLPPVQRPVQEDGDSRPSELVMDSGTCPTIPQRPELTIPPRPELAIPPRPEPATSRRQEPVVPPRPDPTVYSKPKPVVPKRPECI